MKGNIFDGTYHKHENEKDRLRIGGGSWSIPLDWIENKGVHTVRYTTDKAVYEIDLMKANVAGFTRVLQGERKLIVPVKFWTITN